MLMMLLTLLTANAAVVRASSTHKDSDATYTATRAFDGSFKTSWAESKAGGSQGEWLEIDMGRSTQIDNVAIWPGNLSKGSRTFREFSRPRTIQLLVDGKPHGGVTILEDKMHRKILKVGTKGRKIRVLIKDIHEGIVFSDTHIAEVAVNFPSGPLKRYDNWLASSDAKRQHKRFIQKLEDAYTKQQDEEFGDDASFKFLYDSVAEGPPYARKKVASLVPVGFRAQAAPSSGKAMKALSLLQDANAIPAFEMAALRSTGDAQDKATQGAEILRAHQDMIGNQHNNVPFWGETGWNLGAFQSFGEPLALEMDKDGTIFVADTGNNRVQRFSLAGRAEKQWGPGADLADVWFEAGRPWYASGAKAGTAIGEFQNPLDITLIPSKGGPGFAVLDAANRIQVFDSQGRPLVSWSLSASKRARPGLGGDAYLVYLPKLDALLAIVQNQARLHNLQSEELASWTIKDGVPRTVEVDTKGNILMGFPTEVVQYHPEGFRHGTVITSDQMGRGHEDYDMALDEKGKLWILTDAGTVVKFKRPGKIDFSVDAVLRPLKHPRIVVREGIVFFLSDDRIEQVDARQAKLDQEQGAEE